jgi:hypothetical protein
MLKINTQAIAMTEILRENSRQCGLLTSAGVQCCFEDEHTGDGDDEDHKVNWALWALLTLSFFFC